MSKSNYFSKPKVNYSHYYLKNYFAYKENESVESSGEQDEQVIAGMQATRQKWHNQKQRKKKDPSKKQKNGIFITIIILLCFLITAFSADLLSGNFLSRELFAFQRANIRTSYWAVVSKGYQEREKALPEAILARQGGGASYILEEGGEHLVVYNVYLDKASAEAVQKKNPSTNLKQLDIKKVDCKSCKEPLSDKLEEIGLVCEDIIKELYELGLGIEKQELNYFDSQVKVGQIKAPLILLKQGLYNSTLAKTDKDFILLQLEIIMGSLDSLSASSPSCLSFLSDIRYVQVNIIRVYQNLFKYYPSK